MSKLKTKECAGCGKEFIVMSIEGTNPLYCTPKCEKNHTLFKEN